MVSPARKPSAGFWITVALVVALLAYPLSFGPACWITSRVNLDGSWVNAPYRPILLAWYRTPEPIKRAITSYAEWFAAPDWGWDAPPLRTSDGLPLLDADGNPQRVYVWRSDPQ